VVGREVGVKCYGMQGCCAGGRPGVTLRSCRAILQVSASAKRNKSRSPGQARRSEDAWEVA